MGRSNDCDCKIGNSGAFFLLLRFLLDVPASRCPVDSRRQRTAGGTCVAEILLPTEVRRESLANSVTRDAAINYRRSLLPCTSLRDSRATRLRSRCADLIWRRAVNATGGDQRRRDTLRVFPLLMAVAFRCAICSFASFDYRTLPVIALVCCCLQEARERETQIMAGPAGGDSDVRCVSSQRVLCEFSRRRSIHSSQTCESLGWYLIWSA